MNLPDNVSNRIGRNTAGRVQPTLMICASVVLMCVAAMVSGRAGQQPYAAMLAAVGLVTAMAAALVEIDIRREVRLANDGLVAEANVTEVRLRHTRNGDEYGTMTYFFATADGREIERKCRLSLNQTAVIRVGQRVLVVYDPAKPKRNRPVENLRMVEIDALQRFGADGRPVAKLS